MRLNTWLRRAVAVVVMLLMTVWLAACSGSGSSEEQPGVEPAPAVEADGGMPEKGGEEDTGGDEADRLVIRSKVLRLEVESTSDAVTEIRDLARTHDGSITDMQVATDTGEWIYHYDKNGSLVGDGAALRGWVTVRVPSASYEEFLDEVARIGTVKYQSEATTDVTQEHVDLSARLANMRAQEVRLREFFDAAKNVTEMLAIETELGRVRGEIESLDAQVTYLERQAAMATVTIELTEPTAVVRPTGESWGFVEAITDGVRGAAQLVTVTLTVLIASAPLWLAALILFFPIRALLRRRRAGAAAPAPTATPAPAGPEPATVEDPDPSTRPGLRDSE
ncbi:DUF4349 domain-containing protein [Tessaracoccus sp. Z1128]